MFEKQQCDELDYTLNDILTADPDPDIGGIATMIRLRKFILESQGIDPDEVDRVEYFGNDLNETFNLK
jgi:hypothetical protein